MTSGRGLWAGMRILDRQLVTNDEGLAGCVDDLELSVSDDGNDLYVTAIISGPGGLSYRLGARRLGRWLRRLHGEVAAPPRDDPSRIPFNLVADIGADIKLGCTRDEVGTTSPERWVRDHIITHIPGADDEPE